MSVHALLVGMQNGAATTENSMNVSKKLKIELPYDRHLSELITFSHWRPGFNMRLWGGGPHIQSQRMHTLAATLHSTGQNCNLALIWAVVQHGPHTRL